MKAAHKLWMFANTDHTGEETNGVLVNYTTACILFPTNITSNHPPSKSLLLTNSVLDTEESNHRIC